MVPRPEFSKPKLGRKGYDTASVDAMVDRVLWRVNHDRSPNGMSSHELAIALFDEARGAAAYEQGEVDAWMKEMRAQIQHLEANVHEEDLGRRGPDTEGSARDMAAPPHYADRFPRVSRAVLGFAVAQVDETFERLRSAFADGRGPSADEILRISFTEEQGGYRQVAVAQALELVAMARRAQ